MSKHSVTKEFFHEFECRECEGKIHVPAKSIHVLFTENDRPKLCPYCGEEGTMFLDSKHECIPIRSIDVQIQGFKTVDLEIIEHV